MTIERLQDDECPCCHRAQGELDQELREAEQRGYREGVEASAKPCDLSAAWNEEHGDVAWANCSASLAKDIRALLPPSQEAASARTTTDARATCPHCKGFARSEKDQGGSYTHDSVDCSLCHGLGTVANTPEEKERERLANLRIDEQIERIRRARETTPAVEPPGVGAFNCEACGYNRYPGTRCLSCEQIAASAPSSVPALSEAQRDAARAWQAPSEAEQSSVLKRFDDVLGLEMPHFEIGEALLRAFAKAKS